MYIYMWQLFHLLYFICSYLIYILCCTTMSNSILLHMPRRGWHHKDKKKKKKKKRPDLREWICSQSRCVIPEPSCNSAPQPWHAAQVLHCYSAILGIANKWIYFLQVNFLITANSLISLPHVNSRGWELIY